MTLQVTCGLVDLASVPAAVALLDAQFGEHGIRVDPSQLESAARALVLDPSRGALLVARTSDQVAIGVAALAYTLTLEHGGVVAWLDEIYVVPSLRGRGVGRMLLRHAMEVAQRAGARAVELEVDAEHVRAERLYAREGFNRLPRTRWSRTL